MRKEHNIEVGHYVVGNGTAVMIAGGKRPRKVR
jgi:hypothetical protein